FKTSIVFVSYTTPRQKIQFEITAFVAAYGKSLSTLQEQILSHLPAPGRSSDPAKYLVIIDSLAPLVSSHVELFAPFLTSLLVSPAISLLASYHADIPLALSGSPYMPDTLHMLSYLATSILTVSSFPQVLARKRARDRSLHEPIFGLAEQKEGVLIGPRKKEGDIALVVNMEYRRRSGRAISETFVLTSPSKTNTVPNFMVLDDCPMYASLPVLDSEISSSPNSIELSQTTFNLTLTEKQKRDREAVVLPYFDAQTNDAQLGDGGRILYQMGTEDREDFDDEEDEI
ncbi:Bgt-5264, partial [Blumeria graminis f. sp. tritici]